MSRPLPDLAQTRGSAAIWAVLSVSVLLGVAAVALGMVDVTAARQRAAAAADLAALAAAEQWPGADAAAACSVARRVGAAQGAHVQRCAVRPDGSVEVTAAVEAGPWLRSRWAGAAAEPARARARAGTAVEPGAEVQSPFSGRYAPAAPGP